jgi:hypothetical protein
MAKIWLRRVSFELKRCKFQAHYRKSDVSSSVSRIFFIHILQSRKTHFIAFPDLRYTVIFFFSNPTVCFSISPFLYFFFFFFRMGHPAYWEVNRLWLAYRSLCWVCYLPSKARMADNIGVEGVASLVSDSSGFFC